MTQDSASADLPDCPEPTASTAAMGMGGDAGIASAPVVKTALNGMQNPDYAVHGDARTGAESQQTRIR